MAMLPYADEPDRQRRRFPWVMLALVALNVLVFVYELTLSPPALEAFIRAWGVVPAEIRGGRDLPPLIPLPVYATLLTAQFIHGGFLHVASNMVVLFIFGDNVEDALGHGTFLLFYLASGVVAGLANAVLLADETAPGIGASGAIAGVLAAYLLLFPRARVRAVLAFGPFLTVGRVAALLLIGFWFLTQLGQGIGSLGAPAQQGGVGYVAHVGGFVAGALGVALVRRSRGQALGGTPGGAWADRPFRNWLVLVLGVGLLFGASAFLAGEGEWPVALLLRGLVVLAVAVVALWDAWQRIGGRPSFLGTGGNLGRLLAFGQLVLVLAGLAALLVRLT